MIKVCVVVENHPGAVMGGAQYQAHLLAQELASRPDVQVTYLARRIPCDTDPQMPFSYNVRSIGSAKGIRHRAVAFDALELWRALNELQPDVIYQRMKQSYTGICALYARRYHVPFFFHIASEADLNASWRRHRLSMNLPFNVIESIAGHWGLRNATHIVAQTERQSRLLNARYGLRTTEVVRNFQPLPKSLPQKPNDKLRVLWVGNFKDVKRPHLFVKLAEAFAGRQDLEFLMVGRSSNQSRFASLMMKIEDLDNFQYLGLLSLEEVNELMSLADVHVNTSKFEGFPNTFIQAWARGAIVASLGVDVDEGLEKAGIGFCVATVDQLRSVIECLSHNPEERIVVAARAFQYVHDRHSVRNLYSLADRMVAPHRR